MGRTAISIALLTGQDAIGLYSARGVLRTSAVTTFDQANGHALTSAYGAIPMGEPLYLVIANTDTADHVITIAKGASTYAGATGQGDLTSTVPALTTRTIGPLSIPRHAQDGSCTINIDGDSGMAGTITAELRRA